MYMYTLAKGRLANSRYLNLRDRSGTNSNSKQVGEMQSAVKRYYNINKIFMSNIGCWPTQSKLVKILLPTVITSFIFSIGFLEFVRLYETWSTIMQDCECCIVLAITVGGYFKLFTLVLSNTNIERLLIQINYHWRIFSHSTEREIMHDYAIIGRKITISYAVSIYTLMTLYMLIPITPQLLDLVKPLNKSRPNKYLFDVDYSFDREEYYYSVLFHSYMTAVLTMTVMVVVDTIYIVFSQHACSMFSAIGHRLESLNVDLNMQGSNRAVGEAEVMRDKSKSVDYILRKNDELNRELICILQKHQLSIEYVNLLNSSFALHSFLLVFITIIIASLLGIQILVLMDHKEEMIRYVSMTVGAFMHLLVLNFPGQRIMDHSADVFHKAYNMQWYRMSRKTTQLLSILLHRSLVPCTLTAGKIYVLSMANYSATVQTIVSYFTAFSSVS